MSRSTTSSTQLEREAEETRSRLIDTLDELRERITPGELVDQGIDYLKASGGGEFTRNLGRQVTANPLAVTMIGAGIGWLMLSRGGSGPRQAASGDFGAQDLRATAEGAAASLSDRAASAYQATRQAGTAAAEAVSSGYQSVTQAASSAGSRIADRASSLTRQSADGGKNVLQFLTEQPLILAGIGLALGAAIGASLPTTETENQLMGESSDDLKTRAQETAREQLGKGKAVADDVVHAVQEATGSVAPPGDAGHTEASLTEASLVPEAEQQSQHRGETEATEPASGH